MRVVIQIKVSRQERDAITAIARANGQNLTEFVRESINVAASDLSDGPLPLASREK